MAETAAERHFRLLTKPAQEKAARDRRRAQLLARRKFDSSKIQAAAQGSDDNERAAEKIRPATKKKTPDPAKIQAAAQAADQADPVVKQETAKIAAPAGPTRDREQVASIPVVPKPTPLTQAQMQRAAAQAADDVQRSQEKQKSFGEKFSDRAINSNSAVTLLNARAEKYNRDSDDLVGRHDTAIDRYGGDVEKHNDRIEVFDGAQDRRIGTLNTESAALDVALKSLDLSSKKDVAAHNARVDKYDAEIADFTEWQSKQLDEIDATLAQLTKAGAAIDTEFEPLFGALETRRQSLQADTAAAVTEQTKAFRGLNKFVELEEASAAAGVELARTRNIQRGAQATREPELVKSEARAAAANNKAVRFAETHRASVTVNNLDEQFRGLVDGKLAELESAGSLPATHKAVAVATATPKPGSPDTAPSNLDREAFLAATGREAPPADTPDSPSIRRLGSKAAIESLQGIIYVGKKFGAADRATRDIDIFFIKGPGVDKSLKVGDAMNAIEGTIAGAFEIIGGAVKVATIGPPIPSSPGDTPGPRASKRSKQIIEDLSDPMAIIRSVKAPFKREALEKSFTDYNDQVKELTKTSGEISAANEKDYSIVARTRLTINAEAEALIEISSTLSTTDRTAIGAFNARVADWTVRNADLETKEEKVFAGIEKRLKGHGEKLAAAEVDREKLVKQSDEIFSTSNRLASYIAPQGLLTTALFFVPYTAGAKAAFTVGRSTVRLTAAGSKALAGRSWTLAEVTMSRLNTAARNAAISGK